jgi:hypothetical protein
MVMAERTIIFPEAPRKKMLNQGRQMSANDYGALNYITLATLQRDWGCPPSDEQIRLLLDYGIDGEAMTQPYPLGAANVRFNGYTFDIDPERATGTNVSR